MSSTMKVCIVCGKPDATKYKLPHGKIYIHPGCFKKFSAITQEAVPIVWIGIEDFVEHNLFTREEMEGKYEELIDAADTATDTLWDDSFGECFNDLLEAAAVEFERSTIKNTKPEDLPLLLNKLKYPDNKTYLTNRLRKD